MRVFNYRVLMNSLTIPSGRTNLLTAKLHSHYNIRKRRTSQNQELSLIIHLLHGMHDQRRTASPNSFDDEYSGRAFNRNGLTKVLCLRVLRKQKVCILRFLFCDFMATLFRHQEMTARVKQISKMVAFR